MGEAKAPQVVLRCVDTVGVVRLGRHGRYVTSFGSEPIVIDGWMKNYLIVCHCVMFNIIWPVEFESFHGVDFCCPLIGV